MKQYVLLWRYYDGSGSGVLPMVFTESHKAMIDAVLSEIGDSGCKSWKFVEVEAPIQ